MLDGLSEDVKIRVRLPRRRHGEAAVNGGFHLGRESLHLEGGGESIEGGGESIEGGRECIEGGGESIHVEGGVIFNNSNELVECNRN